jgi:hypothetical protein
LSFLPEPRTPSFQERHYEPVVFRLVNVQRNGRVVDEDGEDTEAEAAGGDLRHLWEGQEAKEMDAENIGEADVEPDRKRRPYHALSRGIHPVDARHREPVFGNAGGHRDEIPVAYRDIAEPVVAFRICSIGFVKCALRDHGNEEVLLVDCGGYIAGAQELRDGVGGDQRDVRTRKQSPVRRETRNGKGAKMLQPHENATEQIVCRQLK